jgi:hypothetical protein
MLHRDGTGPVSTTTLYVVPEVPAGVCLLGVRGKVGTSVSNTGVLTISYPTGVVNISDTGPFVVAVNPALVAPGDLITYSVTQYPGQTVVWEFDFYFGAPSDISFE